jgi:hypothetical protein
LFPGLLALGLGLWGAWLGLRGRPTTIVTGTNRSTNGSTKVLPSWHNDDAAVAPPRTMPRDIVWLYLSVAVIAFWTTFGPKAGLYTLLYNTIPVFSFLRAPSRTGIVVTLCLVVLAAPAMTRLMAGRRRAFVFAALLVLGTADLYRAPLRMREAPPLPHAYRTLAQLPRGPVIELPYWYERLAYPRHAEYMLASTAHWQPLINGYSDHIPKDFRDTATPLSTFPSRESFAILEKLGARYAVFHLDLMDPRTRDKLIERVEADYKEHLRPIEKDGEVWLFEIVSWPR